MAAAKQSSNYYQYALILETGLRTGEMIGLTWDAIESGMSPEVLKQLLGHESIKTTMDKYVHVTDDRMVQAVMQFGRHRIFETNSE